MRRSRKGAMVVDRIPNYNSPCLVKLRELIAKHLLSSSIPELQERIVEPKQEIMWKRRFENFLLALEVMFPRQREASIGTKMQELQANLFKNDFLYDILGETPGV